MREKLGVLAPTLMPPVPKRPARTELAPNTALPEPSATDIAETSFPSAAKDAHAAFLQFLAPRSSFWLSAGVLAALHLLILGAAYWMLRARVLH